MKKSYFILIIPFLIGCLKNVPVAKNNQQIDTLKYSYSGFNNGGSLHLLSNGTFEHRKFVYGCTGGGEDKKIYGEYKIENSILYLNDKKIQLKILPIEFNGKNKILELNVVPDSLKLNNKFKIIHWNDDEYLLSEDYNDHWSFEKENDYIRFSHHYNSGLEPKDGGMYLKKEEVNDSSRTKKLDLTQIPLKWRNLFLSEPISTKIISSVKQNVLVDEENVTYWLVEIDKGSDHFVRKGMDFTTEDDNTFFSIDSVLKNKSYSKVYEYGISSESQIKKGTVFRTNWNKKESI